MRRAAATAAACLATLLVLAPGTLAEPPNGIVRPENESTLGPRELGAQLFAGNCSTCHGPRGEGVLPPNYTHGANGVARGAGPPLTGVGTLAADFYLRTGYMPLGDPHHQPEARRGLWSKREIRALSAFINTLGHGPPIPHPNPAAGSVAAGRELFTEHCAGCHQVAAEGGMAPGARMPPLQHVPPVEIAEAVRIGPYAMPQFTSKDISDSEVNSIIAYVKTVNRHDQGGWGIGHIGPVSEGMVTWLIAAVVLVMTCVLIGTRLSKE